MPTPHNTAAAVEFWRTPGLPFFEGRRAVASISCYAPHTHPTWSVGVVDSGTSVFSLPQQKTRQQTLIHPGDVVVIAAHEVHSCNPSAREHWSYRMFHVDCAWFAELLQEAGLDATLLQRSQVLPANRQVQARTLLHDITGAMNTGSASTDSSDDDVLHKETVLVTALCDLMRGWQAESEATADADADAGTSTLAQPDLAPVSQYLRAHCCDKIALEHLAQVAGMGRYQLIRQFRRQYGITPHAMQIDMRINLARELLRRGAALSEVAYSTGFADQSHFQRTFKSRVAATPAQYQDAA